MKKHFVLFAGLLALCALSPAIANSKTVEETKNPRIEVVFVLDTTGSMGGLIQGAKQKIWSIANTMASGKPTPRIKMGLVAYRDRTDQYVTRVTELSADLDAVYTDLMNLQAAGGGDTPESVNQGLHEAVKKIKWSTGTEAYRVIFLVGDCPPHMDYKDDVKYPETCKQAARKGIIINTIQCGNHAATTPIWQKIADRAEGQFFQIAQSGGTVAVSTPYDEKLGKLSERMAETRVYYGSMKQRESLKEKAASAEKTRKTAPASALADRAAFMAEEAAEASFAGRNELVTDWKKGRVKLAEIKKGKLPDELRKMPVKKRREYLQNMWEQREELRRQIAKTQAKRQEHIKQELADRTEGDSFDSVVKNAIRTQARDAGLRYGEKSGK